MKRLYFILLFFFFFSPIKAQTYHLVTHINSQTIGGRTVTVSTINNAPLPVVQPCNPDAVYEIRPFNNNPGGYKFAFSLPVRFLQLKLFAFHQGETVSVNINGLHYPISPSQVSTATYCAPCGSVVINSNGDLTTSSTNCAHGTISIQSSVPIDSITLTHIGTTNSGVGLEFQFGVDTSCIIRQPYEDTLLCQGDSLHLKYRVTSRFGSSNIFTAQLSDATGSFTSPVNIGSLTADMEDTIACMIPANISPGNGYRIRIVSSSPADTSDDNGINIRIKAKPIAPSATANSPLCEGATLNLNSGASSPGASFGWSGSGSFSSGSTAPSRANTIPAWSGDYVVTATLNGCTAKDTVAVLIHPKPARPTAGNNNPVCIGGDINLTATTVPGATYDWNGPGLYYSNQQNAVRGNAQATHGGKYWVTATVNGCVSVPDTTIVNVIQGPEVLMYANPGDSVCPGWNVSFVAVPKNAGGTHTYQWYKNGTFTGGANVTYPAGMVNDGDTFYVKMTAGTACNTPIRSKAMRMTVLPVHTPPTINITATPGNHVWPYVEVTFKASTGNAGAHPGYQWKRNGTNISLAQDSVLKMTDLKTGDTICCVVTSNFLCAEPREVQSNCIVMNVDLSVEKESGSVKESVVIYPNPSNGNFTIEVKEAGILYISNIQGQFISSHTLEKGKNAVTLPHGIAEDVYLLRAVQQSESGKVSVGRIVISK